MMKKEFKRITIYKNGGEIKHLPNRAVTVAEIQRSTDTEPRVGIVLKMLDRDNSAYTGDSISRHSERGATFTGVVLSREAALALSILLNDYFNRAGKEWYEENYKQEDLPLPTSGVKISNEK